MAKLMGDADKGSRKEIGLIEAGLSSIGLLILTNVLIPIAPLAYYAILYISSIATSIGVYKSFTDDLIKFFKASGIKNKDNVYPSIIKRRDTETGYYFCVQLPPGICMSDVEKHKEALEQYLQGKVSFTFKGCLIINVNKNKLETFYPYKLCHYSEPLKVAIGNTRDGIFENGMLKIHCKNYPISLYLLMSLANCRPTN